MNTLWTVLCPICGKMHKVTFSQTEVNCKCGQTLVLYLDSVQED